MFISSFNQKMIKKLIKQKLVKKKNKTKILIKTKQKRANC